MLDGQKIVLLEELFCSALCGSCSATLQNISNRKQISAPKYIMQYLKIYILLSFCSDRAMQRCQCALDWEAEQNLGKHKCSAPLRFSRPYALGFTLGSNFGFIVPSDTCAIYAYCYHHFLWTEWDWLMMVNNSRWSHHTSIIRQVTD